MYFVMEIGGKVFIEIGVDFSGKETVEHRQLYLEEIARILKQEYEQEVKQAEGLCQFYCMAGSRMQFLVITDFDILQMEIIRKANNFLNNKKTNDERKKK